LLALELLILNTDGSEQTTAEDSMSAWSREHAAVKIRGLVQGTTDEIEGNATNPVPFSRTRSTIFFLSASEKKRPARMGESGSQYPTKTPN
jgi:hypothetical protein